MRTLHTALRITDRESSMTFYTALGYQLVGEVPDTPLGHLTMLKLPDDDYVSLELVHDASAAPAGSGLSHIAMHVESLADTIGKLADNGIATSVASSPQNIQTATVTDPDGRTIELVQWPPGHPDGLTAADWDHDHVTARPPRSVVAELLRRQQLGGDVDIDDLVAADMVNHAAGSQGRDGLKHILRTIDVDLGPLTYEQHHLAADGNVVTQHLTLHGTHRNSTMPLLAGRPARGHQVAWTFIHIWRISEGLIVEHWACRDDMGLLAQLDEELLAT